MEEQRKTNGIEESYATSEGFNNDKAETEDIMAGVNEHLAEVENNLAPIRSLVAIVKAQKELERKKQAEKDRRLGYINLGIGIVGLFVNVLFVGCIIYGIILLVQSSDNTDN